MWRFVSLSYPVPTADWDQAKGHLEAMWKRIRRHFQDWPDWAQPCTLWRIEAPTLTRIHLHLVLRCPRISQEWLHAQWQEVLGVDAQAWVWIQALRSPKDAKRAAMYLAKYDAASPSASLDDVSYPAAGPMHTGRVWGFKGKAQTPWAESVVLEVEFGDWFWDLKRLARRRWSGIGQGKTGFMLFTDAPTDWITWTCNRLLEDGFL